MVAVQNKLPNFIRISIFWVKKKIKTFKAIDIEFNCLVVACNVNTFITNKIAYFFNFVRISWEQSHMDADNAGRE